MKYYGGVLALILSLCLLFAACHTGKQRTRTQGGESLRLAGAAAWEQAISVQDGLPGFTLRLHGGESLFTALSIIDSSTGATVYEADFPHDGGGILKDSFSVEVIDMDFDGYRDIGIFTGYGGNWKKDYVYIMWNPGEAAFTGDVYNLAGLGLPAFDAEQKLVRSVNRASAADHWYYTHEYIDGKLVMTEEISDLRIWDNRLDDAAIDKLKELEPLYTEGGAFTHYTRKRLDKEKMELLVVEEKYVLLSQGNKMAEYSPDSEVGLLLAGCEKYSE